MALAPSRPAIRLKCGVKIPARVVSGPGISQSLSGGVLTTSLDFPSLDDNAGVPNPADFTTVLYNKTLERYEEAPLSQLNIPTVAAVRTARGDASYIILSTDRYVGLTASLTAARTWALPSAADVIGGTVIQIRDEAGGISSTNSLTIICTGAETINGASSLILNAPYAGVDLISDGIGKWTIGRIGTSAIAPNAVGNAALRQGTALSVIGRSANTVGNVADITAGTDGHVLRRSGTTLAFGTVALASFDPMATSSLIGRLTAGTGVPEYLTFATLGIGGGWITGDTIIVATSGTLTSATCASEYIKIGRTVHYHAKVVITTNGTGATSLQVVLPFTAARDSYIGGRENQATGAAVTGAVTAGGSTLTFQRYDGTYPGADNRTFVLNGTYEATS